MAQSTRALVAPSVGGSLELQDVWVDLPRPDEVLVEIHAVGICHADISCLNGKIPVKFPNVFGHEGMYVMHKSFATRITSLTCCT